VVNTELRDIAANQVLFSHNFNGREGHTTRSEAANRAIRAVERDVREDFGAVFNAYLTQLSPKLDI
jgi:hypothetical protein